MKSGIIDLRGRGRPRPPVPPSSAGSQRPEQRPLPLRSRRRRSRALAIVAGIIALLAALWGISYVSHLPQYSIRAIEVSGAERLSQKLVRAYAETVLYDGSYHVFSRQNTLLYPREAIERAVGTFFPRIKSVTISRTSLSAGVASITIKERAPYALWCAPIAGTGGGSGSGQCYFMDEGGFIFAERPSVAGGTADTMTQYVFKGGVPAYAGVPADSTPSNSSRQTGSTTLVTESSLQATSSPIGQRFALTHLAGLVSLLNSLGQSGYHPEGVTLNENNDFSIPLFEGFFIKASFGSQPMTLARNLDLVLASDALRDKHDKIEYIDLRFGNRVYYKLFSEGESSFGGKGKSE